MTREAGTLVGDLNSSSVRTVYSQEQSESTSVPPPCIMVIFGASGDLTSRKLMPALFSLECQGRLIDGFRIVGFARTEKDHDQFRREMRGAIEKFSHETPSEEVWQRFISRLYYVTGQYDLPESYANLQQLTQDIGRECRTKHHLYYFAIPPSTTESVLKCMADSAFISSQSEGTESRVMIEKPFGYDLESAQRMNQLLSGLFDESRVYRLDHYIAKDTVRNLLVFRFANAIFEPLWNREHIDNIQITATEEIGIEGRGGYYDQAGIVRDMVQNHVMQVLALIAMEPPLAGDAESVRDKKVEVFKSIGGFGPQDVVFGQYRGYLEERHVDPESVTPTFVALKLSVLNWRWHGVPFYIRAGKAMVRKLTEVVVQFKNVPLCILPSVEACEQVKPNVLVIRIQPDEGMRLVFSTRVPGREERVSQASLDFRYSESGWRPTEAYEQVLLDGISGSPSLFWRSDGIEAAWRVVTPILDTSSKEISGKFPNYEPGSWGPEEAANLLRRDGRAWLPTY